MNAVPYTPALKREWDAFVGRSKNGTFLFMRDYMDYHADRFTDHSLLFYDGPRLVALMPANLASGEIISHGGLTYGGIITDDGMKVDPMREVMDCLLLQAKAAGVSRVLYKAIPHIYHRVPAEEDLYALFRLGARLCRRDVSSTILLSAPLGYSKGRRGCVKKGLGSGIVIRESQDFDAYMRIEEAHLALKHNTKPVHSAEEIRLLAGRFPANIRLFGAYLNETLLGGVIVYVSSRVAHAQYICATEEGKEMGALDAVLANLVEERFREATYFDFGISTTDGGRALDVGLIANKESFGARATVYDFYEIPVDGPS
ncbi:MAG TPA: GNAT family N-acetyltransferase [Planctomycetota bacterium]